MPFQNRALTGLNHSFIDSSPQINTAGHGYAVKKSYIFSLKNEPNIAVGHGAIYLKAAEVGINELLWLCGSISIVLALTGTSIVIRMRRKFRESAGLKL